jgi:hypothetical protein
LWREKEKGCGGLQDSNLVPIIKLWYGYSYWGERLSSKNKKRLRTIMKNNKNMDDGEDCSDGILAELMEKALTGVSGFFR